MEDLTPCKEPDHPLEGPSSLKQQRTNAIRMEERFFAIRKEAEHQLRQINRLNEFSLHAMGSHEENQILRLGIEMLFDLFPLEQGVGFLMDDSKQYKAVSVVALPGCEPIGGLPSLHCLPVHPKGVIFSPMVLRRNEQYDENLGSFINCMDMLYKKGEQPFPHGVVVFIPLSNKVGEPIGMLLAQRTDITNISYHETLPSNKDIPFLFLIARHIEARLESALLHRALSLSAKQLEEQVAVRTVQLENANKELESFSYSVSHDLSAPLRVIGGHLNTLMSEYTLSLPPQAQELLKRVLEGTEKMNQLILDMLALSRIGRQPLQKRPVVVADLVQSALEWLQTEQAGRKVEIKVGSFPICHADPALLKQVWINLLGNALKYTRRRELALIEVGCQGEHPQEGPVFFIKDNGAGFDMKYAHQLFNPFVRLHSAREYEGTGVGLAIVQRIVQRHGGRIWAEAQKDTGAAFFFTLGNSATPDNMG